MAQGPCNHSDQWIDKPQWTLILRSQLCPPPCESWDNSSGISHLLTPQFLPGGSCQDYCWAAKWAHCHI